LNEHNNGGKGRRDESDGTVESIIFQPNLHILPFILDKECKFQGNVEIKQTEYWKRKKKARREWM
jgi:hypothetical protein